MGSGSWFLYALRCADDTLYTGVTTDLERRLQEHNSGRGARYTSGRRPVHLIGAWRFEDRSAAQRAEAAFRRRSRRQKLEHTARRLDVAGAAFCDDDTVEELLSPLRFCPCCGGLLRRARRAEDDRERQACTSCGRIDYENAKPCASVLVVKEGHLLLVRRAIEPYLGHWDIPGGFVEVDELPTTAAIREVEEETGLKIELGELLGFYMGRYAYGYEERRTLNAYFVGKVVGGTEKPADDAADLAWFAPEELPKSIAFEHAHEVLADWVARMRERER